MAETETVICIGGHEWVRVPKNSTQPGPVYDERLVRECGGDPRIVKSVAVTESE